MKFQIHNGKTNKKMKQICNEISNSWWLGIFNSNLMVRCKLIRTFQFNNPFSFLRH